MTTIIGRLFNDGAEPSANGNECIPAPTLEPVDKTVCMKPSVLDHLKVGTSNMSQRLRQKACAVRHAMVFLVGLMPYDVRGLRIIDTDTSPAYFGPPALATDDDVVAASCLSSVRYRSGVTTKIQYEHF